MDNETVSKEEVALELTVAALNFKPPYAQDDSPAGIAKLVTDLYKAILDNLN